jgi:hypothetical protein
VVDYEGYGFDGRIDDVCIYNMTLGADEVAALAGGVDCLSVVAPDVVEPEEDLGGSTAEEDGAETGSDVEEPDDVGTGNEDEQDMGEDLAESSEEIVEITEDFPPGETGNSQTDSSSDEEEPTGEPLDVNGTGDSVSSQESVTSSTRSDGCQCAAVSTKSRSGLWVFMSLLFLLRRRGKSVCGVS